MLCVHRASCTFRFPPDELNYRGLLRSGASQAELGLPALHSRLPRRILSMHSALTLFSPHI